MRRALAFVPAFVLPLASVGALSVPPASASTAVTATVITCSKLSGNLSSTTTLSRCADKLNTGGSGTFPTSSIETGSGTITWNGTGTTTLTGMAESESTAQNCTNTKDVELQVTGTVSGGTKRAVRSIPAGDTISALVCFNTVTEAVSLAPQQKFTITPAA